MMAGAVRKKPENLIKNNSPDKRQTAATERWQYGFSNSLTKRTTMTRIRKYSHAKV
jgi:hypothetical protein